MLSIRHFISISVCIVLSALATLASAVDITLPTVPLNGYPVWLNKKITVLADPAGKLTIEQVGEATAPFVKPPISAEEITKHHVYWLRFRLSNPDASPRLVLINAGPWNDARLFTLDPNEGKQVYREQHSGLLVPATKRPVHLAYYGQMPVFFEVALPPSSDTTFYLRLESDYRFARPSFDVSAMDSLISRTMERDHILYQGVFLGAVLALLLYNLMLFLRIRDTSYAYYVVFLAGSWLIWGSTYNLTLEYLWPSWPIWDLYVPHLAEEAIVVGILQFTRKYLDTPQTLPRFDTALRLMLWSQVLVLIASTILHREDLEQLLYLSVATSFLLALIAAVSAAWISHPLAKYFLVANIFNSVSHLILFAGAFGLIPTNNFTSHVGEFGVVIDGILLSLGLAYRIRRLSDDLAEQRLAEARLERFREEERRELIEQQKLELERRVIERTADLIQERERTEKLLLNILPAAVAEELKATGRTEPRRFEETSILFTDFADFTSTVGTIPAKRMVEELNEIFAGFDDIVDRHSVEKIKTIGDAYMAAAGLPVQTSDHAIRCVRAALDMIKFIDLRNQHASIKWGLRVGIHSGPVVAGIVGKRKYAYDIWGDTVNIASRMESAGEVGRVNLSAYTYDLVRSEFKCEYRGKIGAKGKGEVDMYFVLAETQ